MYPFDLVLELDVKLVLISALVLVMSACITELLVDMFADLV